MNPPWCGRRSWSAVERAPDPARRWPASARTTRQTAPVGAASRDGPARSASTGCGPPVHPAARAMGGATGLRCQPAPAGWSARSAARRTGTAPAPRSRPAGRRHLPDQRSARLPSPASVDRSACSPRTAVSGARPQARQAVRVALAGGARSPGVLPILAVLETLRSSHLRLRSPCREP